MSNQDLLQPGQKTPIQEAQDKLRELFDGFAKSPIVWQEFKTKEEWLDTEAERTLAVAKLNYERDPLVAFSLYARALGLIILANQLGGG